MLIVWVHVLGSHFNMCLFHSRMVLMQMLKLKYIFKAKLMSDLGNVPRGDWAWVSQTIVDSWNRLNKWYILYLRDFQIDVHNWVNFQIHISQFRHSYYSCILQYHSSSVDLFSSRASSLPWLTWEWTPTFALLSSFLALLGWEHLDHLAELFWVVTWRCASRFWSWISLWKFYVMNFSIETRHATVFWWSGDENVLTWS